MSDNARRVALLARPGAARDRMREALEQAGANIVLEVDPADTSQEAVLASRPEAALIVLDAATDEALERFDDLLADPKIDVLFEEAELAIGRVGWDAARWVRHLRAKLGHADSVLPPGRVAAPVQEAEVAPAAAAPATPMPEDAAPAPVVAMLEIEVPAPVVAMLEFEAPAPAAAMLEVEAPAPAAAMLEVEAPAPAAAMLEIEAPAPAAAMLEIEAPVPAAAMLEIEAPAATMQANAAPAPFMPTMEFSLVDDDAVVPVDVRPDMDLVTIELGDEAAHYVHEHEAEPAPPLAAKLELELVDDTPTEIRIEGLELEVDHPSDASRFQDDMADLHSRMAAMELVEDRTSAPMRGAVLVLAGIGGPDAVRQLLGALPEGFPRAVLVQQRLDGGHYDKLVAQMQRATTLPVRLAASGDTLQAGTVYILPPNLGVHQNGSGLAFNDAPSELFAELPANDSAVLMLSGADTAQLDVVMKLAAGGALVAAQALDGCYDVAAPAALAARGGQSGKPQDLARKLAERWH